MYFVMLGHPDENIPSVPLVEEANEDAENNFLGHGFGFEVFQLGYGE